MSLQINASYSPQASTPSVAEGFRELYLDWVKKNPDWRIDLSIVGGNETTAEQARLLEKAQVGEAPDCANVDSFTIPLFIEQGVLQPLADKFFSERATGRPVPARARRDDRARTNTSTRGGGRPTCGCIYRRTDLVPKAPKTWDELIAVAQAG